jgi:4-hydroxy-tetrahydrodipicolinate synthase
MNRFGRLLTAMATPFAEDGTVDYERARQLAQALIASGTQSLVVAGSTGEAATMSMDEKLQLFAEVKDAVGDGVQIIVGTCGNNTAESVHFSREALTVGADAILGTVPWYNKPPQEGLERHFQAIADAVSAPILLYNVPSRTATNMTADTTIRLSRVPNIVGIKEASSNLEAIGRIIHESDDDFEVWSGNDADTLPILALGGAGVVSVASHLVGRQISEMMDCVIEGQRDRAAELHARLTPYFSALFVTTSPAPLKYSLAKVGFPCGGLRLPLVECDPKSAAIMDAVLTNLTVDLPIPAQV